MEEDRDSDKKFSLVPMNSRKAVTKDQLKNAFIAEGLSVKQLANRFNLPVTQIDKFVTNEKWRELRRIYVQEGINKIQNVQLTQANTLLNLEGGFKKLRLIQLETQLEEYAAYYARFGDLKKRHPISGEVLKNDNGMALTIKIPNISREISDLKESVTMSEGLRSVLDRLEALTAFGEEVAPGDEPDVIDISAYDELFEKD